MMRKSQPVAAAAAVSSSSSSSTSARPAPAAMKRGTAGKHQQGGSAAGGAVPLKRLVLPAAVTAVLALWLGFVVSKYVKLILRHEDAVGPLAGGQGDAVRPAAAASVDSKNNYNNNNDVKTWIPSEFDDVLYRARERRDMCQNLDEKKGDDFKGFDKSYTVKAGDETLATLPAFGIIDAIERYKRTPTTKGDSNKWKCSKPSRKSCMVEKFAVVFMAYNPDRLAKSFKQIKSMLEDEDWKTLVEEVVLVWNGERHVDESDAGRKMLEYEKGNDFRFAYPLKMGFPNDLLNRYHPDVVNVTSTPAILYYDDDGPFYSFDAVQGGFELWKRHSTAQIGAMSREIKLGERQRAERHKLSPDPNDRLFVSHCDNLNDQVDYNFRYFANFDANMVLPSGSFLHSNYLCFIWHPVLEEIRNFVRAHPVKPDDMTVSAIVSQVSGRAPRVYSRRLKPPDPAEQQKQEKEEEERRRRLLAQGEHVVAQYTHDEDGEEEQEALTAMHRRLMFSIDWDKNGKMSDMKKYWAALRTEAVNSLVRYFGSINSGSIGWCAGTDYYNPKKDGRCDPIMARQGWLPWMEKDGSVREYCP